MDPKIKEKYRCFTFSHYKLSTIQQGIQSFHAGIELMLRYEKIDLLDYALTGESPTKKIIAQSKKADILHEWAINYKTIVCKNGGDSESLDLMALTLSNQDEYPWAQFNESEPDMMGLLTSIAIVVPVEIYDEGVRLMKNRKLEQVHSNGLHTIFNEHGITFEYTDFEWNLMGWIRECPLAR